MKNFREWLLLREKANMANTGYMEGMVGRDEINDYRGLHQAPDQSNGSPMYDVTKNGTYSDDFYSQNAVRYYGDGQIFDNESIYLVQSLRGKPNASVKIYRAVPKVITNQEKINDLDWQMKYILKYGRLPPHVNTSLDKYKYYDYIHKEIESLSSQPIIPDNKISINPGDWVTTTRRYAQMHGQGTLKNQYRILTKTVKAKDLYTDGNSVHEWGYNPQDGGSGSNASN